MPAKRPTAQTDSTTNLSFKVKHWLAAHKLRNNMDATEYEHVVRGLLHDWHFCDARDRRPLQFGDHHCDFYCHDAKLVAKCDREPRHTAKGKKRDSKRNAYLKSASAHFLSTLNANEGPHVFAI